MSGTLITSPMNAWCRLHWLAITTDPTANSEWCSLRLVTRTLELDRFADQFPRDASGTVAFDAAAINIALAAAAPLCCYLGVDELLLIRTESRGFGKRRS